MLRFEMQEDRGKQNMSIKITLPSPKNPEAAFLMLKGEAEKAGVKFSGDETGGSGSGFGFEVSYEVLSDSIEVTVHDKPFFVSERRIRNAIDEHYNTYLKSEESPT